eukprot:Gregarina_sp_Poly_1__7923@NODE_451_length_8300_cov_116_151585_g334_i1_p1_GENE_NODE_451_length_8300_cov_116_151585_g334_i1NODE_451_length_8300_cov_116_151585_g334_i1_p1_ORF_typecomplete_len2300_score244_59RCC1/PF00415_18/0_39RCC1/PF00415_18/7_9e02RCC1/PF00415_18/2_3e03RCC1/PF00415_18/0_0094RCC1/PF00415_18/0_23RCC1/PF00415_18/0_038RCC1/PF00415_18/1_7e03RCC1_2/PF13540_6/5_1e03RCC1_2/PF13540_6/3_2RCC1_2/PF13540_6/8_8e02RCC1_2/PF13540_6/3_2RCC1_2/PF13540_6/0_037RCC1_2/PF13540_6/22RCC1_2/PF13540_6/1_4
MLCGETSRFIHVKSPEEVKAWEIKLEDFKIQLSNFSHLFTLPSMTACYEGSEVFTHSLIKLPLYVVRWESMPDHAQTPCTLLQDKCRISLQGTVIAGWPQDPLNIVSCPASLKLENVCIDQLPSFLLWAIHHCPEQVPCTVWVNDPHSGLVSAQLSLPSEVAQSYFVIQDFRYEVLRNNASFDVTLPTLANFVAYAFDSYFALFSAVTETSWQLLRNGEYRSALIAMVSDSDIRARLKRAADDKDVLRTLLTRGIPFGHGWIVSSSDRCLPPTSLHISQIASAVTRLLQELLSNKTSSSDEPRFSKHDLYTIFSAESVHTATWSGESLLYLISKHRSRCVPKYWDLWTSLSSRYHIVDGSNPLAVRNMMIACSMWAKLGAFIETDSVPQNVSPISFHCKSAELASEVFMRDYKWLHSPLGVDITTCAETYCKVTEFLRTQATLDAAVLSAGPPMFAASFLTSQKTTLCISRLLEVFQPQSNQTRNINANVVSFLLDKVKELIDYQLAKTLLVPPKPSLCLTSSGELVVAFRVVFLRDVGSVLTEENNKSLLSVLVHKVYGFLSDYSRSTLIRDLRSFADSKPSLCGLGLLFFKPAPSANLKPIPHFPRVVIPKPSGLHSTPCAATVDGSLLNRWEHYLRNPQPTTSFVLWSIFKTLLDVYDEAMVCPSQVNGNLPIVLRGIPLSVAEAEGKIDNCHDWNTEILLSALTQTATALCAIVLSECITSVSPEGGVQLLRDMARNEVHLSSDFVEGVLAENLFLKYVAQHQEQSATNLPVSKMEAVLQRAMKMIKLETAHLVYCFCVVSGFIVNPGKQALSIPYKSCPTGMYDLPTMEGMSSISNIIGHKESLPMLRLMLYEGETPELRNVVKKTVLGIEHIWHSIAICTAIKRSLFGILNKAFNIVNSVMKKASADLFHKGSLLYDYWQSALTLLQDIKWLHCLVVKCPDNYESSVCNLLCSVGWVTLSLLLGRFTPAVRWSEYAFVSAVSLRQQSLLDRPFKSIMDRIASFAIQLLTSSAYFLNDPDLSIIFGTLARWSRNNLVNPKNAADLCSTVFTFQIGPPELPPTERKVVARIPCRKRVYSIISALQSRTDNSIFEILGDKYLPYDVRTLLNTEVTGSHQELHPFERTEVENCEAASILLHHLAFVPTFRKISLTTDSHCLEFTHTALDVLASAISELEPLAIYFETCRLAAEDSKSIRRAIKSEYTCVLRATSLWTRGNNGQAAALGIGRPKCFRYEDSLASTDPKFKQENEAIKRQGEEVWWTIDPVPCTGVNCDIIDTACGEYHTVCLTRDRMHLVVMGSTREGQLGFTVDSYRMLFKDNELVSDQNSMRESFKKLRRKIRDNYLSQFIFSDVKSGVVSKPSSNYSDIKYHLPWSLCRPLLVSVYDQAQQPTKPLEIEKIGAGATYTAVLLRSGIIVIFGCVNDINSISGENSKLLSQGRRSSSSSSRISTSRSPASQHFSFPSTPTSFSCGPFHLAVVTQGHRLFIWGKGDAGQLGLPLAGKSQYESPKEMIVYKYSSSLEVTSVTDRVSLMARTFQDLCTILDETSLDSLFENGSVWWSQETETLLIMLAPNSHDSKLEGALWTMQKAGRLQLLEFLSIACGEAHCIAIVRWRSESRRLLACWGQNEYGQLGNSNLQFVFSREDALQQNLDFISDKYQKSLSNADRRSTKLFLDFIPLRDESLEPLAVFSGGTNSACSVTCDPRVIFVWGNNDRGCLCRPEEQQPFIPQPVEIRFDQDVRKVHLGLGDPSTLIQFGDGSVKSFGLISGLGGNSVNGTWNVPRTFEFSTARNWMTANRISEKQFAALRKSGQEFYDGCPKEKPISRSASRGIRIPFAIRDLAVGSAHTVFVVNPHKDLINYSPNLVLRRSVLLKTARSVQRDSATSTRTTTASDRNEVKSQQANELYGLIEQGPHAQEEIMNKILVDLKRPWDPPLTHDLTFWVNNDKHILNGTNTDADFRPRNQFLHNVGQSGLQGLTHLSQLLVTNVVQKGIENVDHWIETRNQENSIGSPKIRTSTSPGGRSVQCGRRPHTSTLAPASRKGGALTPCASPRLRRRNERVPTHRSLDAPLMQDVQSLPNFELPNTAESRVPQQVWDDLNCKLNRTSPTISDMIFNHVSPPKHIHYTPPNSGLGQCKAAVSKVPTTETIQCKPLSRTADQASSRSGSDRTASIQAGSTLYMPRRCIRPKSAQVAPIYPPPVGSLWPLSRPIQPVHPASKSTQVYRTVTDIRVGSSADFHHHGRRDILAPPLPWHKGTSRVQGPRILEFDGQGYSSPGTASNGTEIFYEYPVQ